MECIEPRAAEFIRARFGPAAEPWLAALPGRIKALEAAWGITVTGVLPGATTAAVLAARSADGVRCVLKLTLVDDAYRVDLAAEHRWYRAHPAASPAPHALHLDHDWQALLVEHLEGVPAIGAGALEPVAMALASLGPAPAGTAAWDVPGSCRVIHHRLHAAGDPTSLAYLQLLTDAEPELACAAAASARYAHGDVNTSNALLDSSGRLRLIDPAPCRAPLAAELSRWACEPANGPGFAERLERFAALGFADADELWSWARLCVGISYGFACWSPTASDAFVATATDQARAMLARLGLPLPG